MPSAELLDFEALLAPVVGENPAGPDLRLGDQQTGEYFRLKDARFAARAAERRLESGQDADSGRLMPEWQLILELAPKTIAKQSKDLEIASWLIEALIRGHGFAGLRDGFRLAAELVERFWDNLYPLPDDEGMITRVAPLTALNGEGGEGTLILPIRRVPLTEAREPGPFAYWHYQQGTKLAELGNDKAKAARIQAGAVTIEQINQSASKSTPAFYRALIDDLARCQAEFKRLNELVTTRCGADAPPVSNIRENLEIVAGLARTLGGPFLPPEPLPGNGQMPDQGNAEASSSGSTQIPAGEPRNREDAFELMIRAADFFKRNEPHSPLSYALMELVRRGRMPLPDLLRELIPDDNGRRNYVLAAGMRPEVH